MVSVDKDRMEQLIAKLTVAGEEVCRTSQALSIAEGETMRARNKETDARNKYEQALKEFDKAKNDLDVYLGRKKKE